MWPSRTQEPQIKAGGEKTEESMAKVSTNKHLRHICLGCMAWLVTARPRDSFLSGSISLLSCDQKVTVWGVRIENCLSTSALHGSSSARPSLVMSGTCMTFLVSSVTAYCGLPGKPVPSGFLDQIFSNVTVK